MTELPEIEDFVVQANPTGWGPLQWESITAFLGARSGVQASEDKDEFKTVSILKKKQPYNGRQPAAPYQKNLNQQQLQQARQDATYEAFSSEAKKSIQKERNRAIKKNQRR